MIPSVSAKAVKLDAVYQRGWMIDSQLLSFYAGGGFSISKGMDD